MYGRYGQALAASEAEKGLQTQVEALETVRMETAAELEALRAQTREREAAAAQEVADLQRKVTESNERVQLQVRSDGQWLECWCL